MIECCKRGMPARRCFRVSDDVELLEKFLEKGEVIMAELNPISQKQHKIVPSSRSENVQQVGAKCNDKLAQNEPCTYNPNIKKLK